VAEPRWLTDDEQRTWRKLAVVLTRLPAALDAQLQRDSDMSHFAYWVLAMLSEAPARSLRMSELAARANSSQSRLSHQMSRLEQRGWVRRERSPEDARGNVAVLTGKGWDALVEAAPGHVAAVRAYVFEGLSAAQLRQLDAVCTALLARLGE
jgi:DNA-binding MarR family transcriptional regulator